MIPLTILAILSIHPLMGWEPQEVRVDVRIEARAKPGEWVCVDISGPVEHRSCWVQTPLTRKVESRRYVLGAGEYRAKVMVGIKTLEESQVIRILEHGRCMDMRTGESGC